jgi:L,D-transpeptidase catalytic domain
VPAKLFNPKYDTLFTSRCGPRHAAWVDELGSDGAHMESYFFNPKHRQTRLRLAGLAFASFAALMAANDLTDAASLRKEQLVESRPVGEPTMAVVSLRDQQITVYDAQGRVMRAPVSSGQKGRETPAGIFTVLQKEAEHYSNMYDDAYMPHMQRLTWTGIALHGGPLPGYPASHGCIRMPYDFAERLFNATRLGMRVIVAPNDVVPVRIDHPVLFQPKTGPDAAAAQAAIAQADEAASNADKARLAAVTAAHESALASVSVRKLEISKLRAQTQLAAAERATASAELPEAKEQAEDAKAKVTAQISELEAQLATAKAELQPKLDAVLAAREAAIAAENARVVAAEAARKAARDLEPVSVFISRKTQRLYVRQAFQPILEIPVTIQDPDRPIGTHIFTAMERSEAGNDLRWSVVSFVGSSGDEPNARKARDGDVGAMVTDVSRAKTALERITIPHDTLDRIAEMVSPRSSLIISDEALSSETGKGTEFVVVMSDEPQGGLKHRRRYQIDVRYDRPGVSYWRWPGRYSAW